MDIRTLRYFLAVAREENITRAAERLHIAQLSLSKQMMELEKELGTILLIRGKRKVTLTEEGVLLRKRAEEIVSMMDRTEQEFHSSHQSLSGKIAIGGNPNLTILQAAAAMRSVHPEVSFAFYSGDGPPNSADRLRHIRHGHGIQQRPMSGRKEAGSLFWGIISAGNQYGGS